MRGGSYGQDWSVVVSHGQEVKSWWPEEYENAMGRCRGVLCVSIPLLAIQWFLKILAYGLMDAVLIRFGRHDL